MDQVIKHGSSRLNCCLLKKIYGITIMSPNRDAVLCKREGTAISWNQLCHVRNKETYVVYEMH